MKFTYVIGLNYLTRGLRVVLAYYLATLKEGHAAAVAAVNSEVSLNRIVHIVIMLS